MINAPFDPPKGKSISEHLYDIRAAKASTSLCDAPNEYLIPPLTGSLCSECTHLKPVKVWILFFNVTPKFTVYVEFANFIFFAKSSGNDRSLADLSNI